MNKRYGLLREASRRKVFRTAGLYIVAAWLALQVANTLFPGFDIADAAIRALFWTAVLGFPVAIVFGWFFEVGPWGIRRTAPAAAGALPEPQPLARRDYLILAAFAAIAVLLLVRAIQEVREMPLANSPPAAAGTVRADPERLPNSIAVLPFANISNEPDNEFFCDGVSEEILNALSGFHGLNVIGRTSSFAFKGSDAGIDRISAVLGVGHVLQGSVRKAGRQLRISAQLLDEAGRQVWTETFDRELANVFEIQEEIAQAVAATVARQLAARPDAAHHPNVEAYDHYLAGREHLHRRQVDRAREELERAIDLDPAFAEAHAEWAIASLIGAPTDAEIDAARAAIDRAIELQPKLLRAQAARGFLLLRTHPPNPTGAETVLRGVLEQDPNMGDALNWLASALAAQDRQDEMLPVFERAARIDPLHPAIAANLSTELWQRGKVDQALAILERQLEHPDAGGGSFFQLRDRYRRTGRLVELHAVAREQSSRLITNHYSLSLSYALLGNWQGADYWLERTPRDFPNFAFRWFGASMVPAWQDRNEEAARSFEEALVANAIDIAAQDPFVQRWHGTLLARAGRHAEAIAVLEPLVPPDTELLPDAPTPKLDAPHALAWSYLNTGATAQAEALLAGLWGRCQAEPIDHDSDLLHYCAETALLRGERDQALDLFERAVEAGWREYYLRQQDPYWAALEDAPRYRALMARVKADVDRQAVEITRLDAAEDVIAKVEATVAERRRRE